jgi:glycosyltransferase involved in cell wall biosynthesis
MQQAVKLHIAPLHKLVTICNGIDPQPFITASQNRTFLRGTLGIPKGYLVIGSTGRLSPHKDNATLIRAAALLRENLPDLNYLVLLAGDGPDLPELYTLTRELNLMEHVRFLGFWHQIPELLGALDVFVSSSLREGLSISILEAMAAAKPIIATSILPNQELIDNEVSGLLVPPKSPERIAKAIQQLIENPDLKSKYGLAARERVLADYTIERMFDQTLGLYNDLLNSNMNQRHI